jgi:hypothetical protein
MKDHDQLNLQERLTDIIPTYYNPADTNSLVPFATLLSQIAPGASPTDLQDSLRNIWTDPVIGDNDPELRTAINNMLDAAGKRNIQI